MAKVKSIQAYDGAEKKIRRLGLQPLVDDVTSLVEQTEIRVLEEIQANGAAAIRQLLDLSVAASGTWQSKKSGDVDWSKCKVVNGTRVCVGVEVQVSARSELLYKDILHLKNRVTGGDIDLGIIIVPSDRLHSFLPDRTPSKSYAEKVIREQDADRLPILLIEMEHDGPGRALPKKITNTSRAQSRRR
jgi:hypothetical protein